MKTNAGFTLIELLIVVALIGILAAIAIPNYSEYVIRGKITDGLAVLSQMSTKMEQHFQDNRDYLAACGVGGVAPQPTATRNFTFSCPVLNSTTYLVRATGINQMAGFSYTIAPNDVKRTESVGAGWPPITANCWVRSKSGC